MNALDAIRRVALASGVVNDDWTVLEQRLAISHAPDLVGPGEQGYWCVAVELARKPGEAVVGAAYRLRQYVEVHRETYGVDATLAHVLEGDL